MNIFKSLSLGNGTISETNITSFLSYLLNSTNELNNAFLLLFFELVDEALDDGKIYALLNLPPASLRDRIIDFSKRYSVTSDPEHPLDGRKQIVDIFLKVSTKEGEEVAYFLIENKIKKEANKPLQAANQFARFINSSEYTEGLPVYSIVLTTDNTRFTTMHTAVKAVNTKAVWLRWTNHKEPERSIEAMLRKLIRLEHDAEIQPIDPNTQFIVKSFVDYILSEYSQRAASQRNFSFNGFDVVSSAAAEVKSVTYIIKRYENDMVRLFDTKGTLLEVDVKPILREINKKLQLGISLTFPGGRAKNTQVLGKDVINELNRRKV